MKISEIEFKELILKTNDELADECKSISSRPINATINILKKYNISGPIVGNSESGISFPVTNINLCDHVDNWYQSSYGDSLKVDFTQGTFPVEIDGTVFKCKAPLIFGQALIIASKGTFDKKILNVVDCIHELPSFARERLSSDTEGFLTPMMKICLDVKRILRSIDSEMLSSAISDIGVSCDLLIGQQTNSSLSAWHSLQFTEKVIKHYISKHEEPKWTHEIKKLRNKAKLLGYEPDERINWDLFKFDPTVRYNPNQISKSDALAINHEAWRIAWDILHQL